MIDLKNAEEIKKLDPKDVYGSTGLFADQCQYMVDNFFDTELVAKNVIDTQTEKAKAQSAQLASLVGVSPQVLRIISGLVKS